MLSSSSSAWLNKPPVKAWQWWVSCRWLRGWGHPWSQQMDPPHQEGIPAAQDAQGLPDLSDEAAAPLWVAKQPPKELSSHHFTCSFPWQPCGNAWRVRGDPAMRWSRESAGQGGPKGGGLTPGSPFWGFPVLVLRSAGGKWPWLGVVKPSPHLPPKRGWGCGCRSPGGAQHSLVLPRHHPQGPAGGKVYLCDS